MGKKLTQVSGLVLRSWDTLLCFELLYRALGHGLLFPAARSWLERIPSLLGLPHLGQRDVGLALRSPAALLVLAGVLLLVAFYLLLELVALLLYCEAGWRRERITLGRLCRASLRGTATLFRPRRIALLLLAPPLLLSVFSLASGWLRAVRVPEFVLDHIRSRPGLLLLYAGAVLACHWLLFHYLFGLPAMLLEGASFAGSWRESRRLLRGRKLRALGGLLAPSVLFAAATALAAGAAVLLLGGYTRSLADPEQGRALFQFYALALNRSGALAAGALLSVLLCAVTLALYHACRGDPRPEAPARGPGGLRPVLMRTVFVLFTLALLVLLSESELGGSLSQAPADAPQLVAHRAGGLFAPENTVAALRRAIADGADQAELDVRRLRDGTLIVLHDASLRRTTGTDLAVRDADLAAVAALDAGSSFSPAYAGEPVPTLDAALEAAKGRIRLMLELKGSGEGLERAVLDLLRAHGMEAQCSIASMDLDALRRVKALAPHVRTVYISALLLSERYDLQYVDGYSVETTSLSVGAVAQAHLQGKEIYGWTANSVKPLSRLLRCRVDGIVTDNVPLARYCVETNGEDLWLDALTDLFF